MITVEKVKEELKEEVVHNAVLMNEVPVVEPEKKWHQKTSVRAALLLVAAVGVFLVVKKISKNGSNGSNIS